MKKKPSLLLSRANVGCSHVDVTLEGRELKPTFFFSGKEPRPVHAMWNRSWGLSDSCSSIRYSDVRRSVLLIAPLGDLWLK